MEPGGECSVDAFAIDSGIVYVGGGFSDIGTQARSGVAAIDRATGVATSWQADTNGGVLALLLDGDRLYTAGNFSKIGGATRNSLAAVDRATGAVLSWNPAPSADVRALASIGNVIYAGGSFTNIGGQPAIISPLWTRRRTAR